MIVFTVIGIISIMPETCSGDEPVEPVNILVAKWGGKAVNVSDTITRKEWSIILRGKRFTDDNLKELAKYSDISGILISSTSITEAGLVHLKSIRGLSSLTIRNQDVTAAGLAEIGQCADLWSLKITSLKMRDQDIAPLKRLLDLSYLDIGGAALTNECLRTIGTLRNLTNLTFSGIKVNDDGIMQLKNLSKLRHLLFLNSGVSQLGVKKLGFYLPGCRIQTFNTD